jgi:5-methylcytosine-specific restriction endonuclease McrA
MAEWNQCYYCGTDLKKEEITFDHVIPKSFGGTKMVTACRPCNNKKGHETLDWFRRVLGVALFFGERMGWQPW